MDDKLLTPAEIMKYIGVESFRKYRGLIDAGMPHVWVGTNRRFVKEKVLAWLETQEKSAAVKSRKGVN